MADTTPLSRPAILPSERQTYERSRQVNFRASVTEGTDSDRVQRAISRLDAFLAGGKPPRTNVPPGFYLNIKV